MHFVDAKKISGQTKEAASDVSVDMEHPYAQINHSPENLPHPTDYDYMLTLNSAGKEDSIYLTPTSETFSFEGRESVNDLLTDFDQFVKDFFYPIINEPYGIVKDIAISDGNGQVATFENGYNTYMFPNANVVIIKMIIKLNLA